MDWTGLAKHTVTLCTSSFDVGSDITNALMFMGYFNTSNNHVTPNESNSSFHFNNESLWEKTTDDEPNVTAVRDRVHQIWGTIGLVLVFVPGLITILPSSIGAIYEKKWFDGCKFLIRSLVFPFTFIVFQLVAVIMTCFKAKVSEYHQMKITRYTGIEASVESCGQLLLQIFSILYGYETTTIQKITIMTSFIQLTKCSIMMDVETNLLGSAKKHTLTQMFVASVHETRKELTFKQLLSESVKRLPCYLSSIIFRVMSLALTMAFLRIWSILPIGLLVTEISIIGWMSHKKMINRMRAFMHTINLTLGNCGVMMAYPFFLDSEEREEIREKDVQNFVCCSSIATFLHHTATLSIIMVLVWYDPYYMEHWSAPYFLLNPINAISRHDLFWAFGCTILMGCYSTTVSMYGARNITDVEVKAQNTKDKGQNLEEAPSSTMK